MTTIFTVSQMNGLTVGNQSPPVSTVLPDGRVVYFWAENALTDNTTTMRIQGIVYNADGTINNTLSALNGLWAVDGANGYDWPNLSVNALSDGKVVLSYVRNTAETGGDEPVFSIIDTDIVPIQFGFYVALNVEIQENDITTFESPPSPLCWMMGVFCLFGRAMGWMMIRHPCSCAGAFSTRMAALLQVNFQQEIGPLMALMGLIGIT